MREALAVCEAYFEGWAPSYVHHTRLVANADKLSKFRMIWSKPTKEKPIAELTAEVDVEVDMSQPEHKVVYSFSGSTTVYAAPLLNAEATFDRLIEQKQRVRSTLALLETDSEPWKGRREGFKAEASGAAAPGATANGEAAPGAPADESAPLVPEDDDELERLLVKLFTDADLDGNGGLDMGEFYKLLRTADLGLSTRDAAFILGEADVSGDGLVQYSEFAPLAVDVIQSLRLRDRMRSASADAEVAAEDEAVTDLHNMDRHALEALMRSVFEAADVSGDGKLSRKEFASCLERVRLGPTRLTKREMRYFQVSWPARAGSLAPRARFSWLRVPAFRTGRCRGGLGGKYWVRAVRPHHLAAACRNVQVELHRRVPRRAVHLLAGNVRARGRSVRPGRGSSDCARGRRARGKR